MVQTLITSFKDKLNSPLTKKEINTLQINLGKRCNLACTHCHVEASPKRTEELSPEVCNQLIEVINKFPQIQTVDLTGGAPEMNYGFKPLVEAATKAGKKVITFDLNPLSRTSQTANITIVDNVTRAIGLLTLSCKKLSKRNKNVLKKIVGDFNNKKNLSDNIIEIRDNLTRRSHIA